MASSSHSHSRSGKSSMFTVVPLAGRYDEDSVRRYMAATQSSSSSSSDLIQAMMHLVSCGWRIKQGPSGVFYVSQESYVTGELIEACGIQMGKKSEIKMEEPKEDQEVKMKELEEDQKDHDAPRELLCILCNDGYYTGDFLETGFCSPNCQIFSTYMEHQLWKQIDLAEDFRWSLMLSDRNLTKPDQKQELRDAAAILAHEFGDLADRLIFEENFYVAAVWKANAMTAVVIFKLHPNATTVFAQMPLAATHINHRGKGCLKALMMQLEKVLRQLKVKKIVQPSLPATLYMWVKHFGFATIPCWELDTFLKENRTILNFDRTVFCYKILF